MLESKSTAQSTGLSSKLLALPARCGYAPSQSVGWESGSACDRGVGAEEMVEAR
jgi:hypothetical protein